MAWNMNNGWPIRDTDNNSEESPQTTHSDNISLYSPKNSLKPQSESTKHCPKSCLKQKRTVDPIQNIHQPTEVSRTSNQIFIPIGQGQDKKKTMGYQRNKSRRLKTNQERVYMFLEHPGGWVGFAYHMSV